MDFKINRYQWICISLQVGTLTIRTPTLGIPGRAKGKLRGKLDIGTHFCLDVPFSDFLGLFFLRPPVISLSEVITQFSRMLKYTFLGPKNRAPPIWRAKVSFIKMLNFLPILCFCVFFAQLCSLSSYHKNTQKSIHEDQYVTLKIFTSVLCS